LLATIKFFSDSRCSFDILCHKFLFLEFGGYYLRVTGIALVMR
jgi:hypothetical protein